MSSPEFIERIHLLPSLLPARCRREEGLGPRPGAQDYCRLICRDPALCARVISAANSPHLGRAYKVASWQEAVELLGEPEVDRLCREAMRMAHLAPRAFADPQGAARLWRHSLAVAEASALLCRDLLPGKAVDAAYTAGLLHDLGQVLLMAFLPLSNWFLGEGSWDHQDLALALAQDWHFPALLSEVMARHHQPHQSLAHLHEVSLVHLADCLCRQEGLGEPQGQSTPSISPLALEVLRLDQAGLAACQEQVAALASGWPGPAESEHWQ